MDALVASWRASPRILCALDAGDAASDVVLRTGLVLLRTLPKSTRLTVLHADKGEGTNFSTHIDSVLTPQLPSARWDVDVIPAKAPLRSCVLDAIARATPRPTIALLGFTGRKTSHAGAAIMGSEGDLALRQARCPTLLVKPPSPSAAAEAPQLILVGMDATPVTVEALAFAAVVLDAGAGTVVRAVYLQRGGVAGSHAAEAVAASVKAVATLTRGSADAIALEVRPLVDGVSIAHTLTAHAADVGARLIVIGSDKGVAAGLSASDGVVRAAGEHLSVCIYRRA